MFNSRPDTTSPPKRSNSADTRKRFDTSTRPKSATSTKRARPNPCEGLESDNPADWPADFGDSSAPSASPPTRPAPAPLEPRFPSLELEEIKNLVIDTANQFLLDNLLGGEDLSPDEVADGHPPHYLLSKARSLNDQFREHRLPNPLDQDYLAKMTSQKRTSTMETYAQRIIRATAPPTQQKRAKWRNFIARSSRKMNELITKGQVQFNAWYGKFISPIFLAIPLGGFSDYKKRTSPLGGLGIEELCTVWNI